MAALDLEVHGLADLRSGIEKAQKDLARENRRSNKAVAAQVVAWAQSDARGGTRQQARAAAAIKPRGTQNVARIAIDPGAVPFALAAFFGMQRRTGWFAHPRYGRSVGRQAPEWVGNNWIAGRPGEGPHVINEKTIPEHLDEIERMYMDGYERALKAAFPGGMQ